MSLEGRMITLYSAATPNGHKASIALEELGLAYGLREVDLLAGEQKDPWFVALNPNARIPVIVDHDAGDHVVFESGAILFWLADKAGRLLPTEAKARSEVVQWLMFQMGGLGPMMGQANVFSRYAPEKVPYAIGRYQRESRRLLEVIDARLDGRDYLAGDYSIADIANFAWARTHRWSGVSIEGLARLSAWIDRIAARPAVVRGLDVPKRQERTADDVERTGKTLLV